MIWIIIGLQSYELFLNIQKIKKKFVICHFYDASVICCR